MRQHADTNQAILIPEAQSINQITSTHRRIKRLESTSYRRKLSRTAGKIRVLDPILLSRGVTVYCFCFSFRKILVTIPF